MVKRTEHRGSFSALDATGKAHRLEVYVDILGAATLDHPNAEVEGIRSIRTADGHHVNRLEKGRYHVVETATDLTSDAADAP